MGNFYISLLILIMALIQNTLFKYKKQQVEISL